MPANSNPYYSLGLAIQGKNLNSVVLRGFANLGILARFSHPDVFNAYQNPHGTQRPLNPKHSKEALEYAMGSLFAEPDTDLRSFPEIILNVRDESVVEITQLDSEVYAELKDYLVDDWESTSVLIKIDQDAYTYPAEDYNPQISRVDGNHRLSQASKLLEAGHDYDEFPVVPFAMYIGLTTKQERKLFSDINGKQRKMSGNLLITMGASLVDDPSSLTEPQLIEWLAHSLTGQGMAFENMANMGGTAVGYSSEVWKRPPLTSVALRAAVKALLTSGKPVKAAYRAEPERLLELINSYFTSVKNHYPEAWLDKDQYILLDSIGLGGFSKLGGSLASMWLTSDENDSEKFFDDYLSVLSSNLSVHRREWSGLYGAMGGVRVFEKCMQVIYNQTGTDVKGELGEW
jgi:DGQHR domain-containing protein